MPVRFSISSYAWGLWLKAFAVSVFAVFAPTGPMLAATFGMVFADFVLGLMCSHKLKEPITSHRMKNTVYKLALYETAIILAFVCQTWLTGDLLPFTKLCAGAIGLVEMLSILENLNCLTNSQVFKPLLDRLSPPGPRGVQGWTGPRGPTGPQGEDGIPGKPRSVEELAPVVLQILKENPVPVPPPEPLGAPPRP